MKKVIIFFIKSYQKYLSPLTKASCKYYPTCSEYCTQAINKYGVIKGMVFSAIRIIKCNPFSKGGYDPLK